MKEKLERLRKMRGACRIGRVAYRSEIGSISRKAETEIVRTLEGSMIACYGPCYDCRNDVEWREYDCEGNVHCRNIGNDRYYAAEREAEKRIGELEKRLKEM